MYQPFTSTPKERRVGESQPGFLPGGTMHLEQNDLSRLILPEGSVVVVLDGNQAKILEDALAKNVRESNPPTLHDSQLMKTIDELLLNNSETQHTNLKMYLNETLYQFSSSQLRENTSTKEKFKTFVDIRKKWEFGFGIAKME